jgi:hypothetical protein
LLPITLLLAAVSALPAASPAQWCSCLPAWECEAGDSQCFEYKAQVDSIVWAQGQGQVMQSGMVPNTGAFPLVPGRFPVKLEVAERDRELFLPAGATGHGAIYTENVHAIHILRMVILRVGTITDFLVLKLH